jgi:hypothetical protein
VYVIINVLSPISSGSQTFDAWAENAGSRGNIPAYDIDHLYNMVNDPSIVYYLQNTQAFSGGQDAYTFVQQSDIDDATNDLQTQLTNDAQTAVQKQIQGDEQTIGGISCNSKTSANHRANDKAADVTVKVSVTCKAEVYSPQEIQSMAAALLKSDATTQLGGDYLLVDYVLTGTPTLLTTGNDGTASFSVKAEGIWVFQFNDARKQQVAHSITGKSQADTKAFLLKQPGIRKVSIVTSGGWGSALPTSPHAIKFIVVNVPGLQAT